MSGIDHKQLKRVIIIPTLMGIDMHSASAVTLLLGTAIQESNCGQYLVQINGPACGIYQMEPLTGDDILNRYIINSNKIYNRICNFLYVANETNPERIAIRLKYDLRFATILARVKYWMDPEPLPAPSDIEGMAEVWKRVYNTKLGKGTEEQFVNNWKRVMG